MTRVAVFVDYQNMYCGARQCFGLDWHYTTGQIFPRRLGVLLTDRGRTMDPTRRLEYVMVFRGIPSSRHSPKGQAAADRQTRFWAAQASVTPVTRPLKYYRLTEDDWLAREKGIDVLLALALVVGAMRDEYDVAVVCSADTDLLPAVEQVVERGKRCEVAAWDGPCARRSRLALPGVRLWCHWLNQDDYRRVEDRTDYTLPQEGEPPTNP